MSAQKKNIISFCVCAWLIAISAMQCGDAKPLLLAKNGVAQYAIAVSDSTNIAQSFAAGELADYLHRITNANFTIHNNPASTPLIRLEKANGENPDAYSIEVSGKDILLRGHSDRAILYAVYDLLEQCGCRWWAPEFEMYNGKAEYVPAIANLTVELQAKNNCAPVFKRRVIDVDGGRTHNATNLRTMVDWMAKVRFNTLRVPVNLNGNGRVVWDKWKDSLLPELRKRDMVLEIGGHGYQNFLNADMENNTLFKKHPEWFGKDSACAPSPSNRLVFNTGDTAAVNYFTANIVNYIQNHPDINIFGIWPPDVGHWNDCAEMDRLGTPSDRQAVLVNQVEDAITQARPGVRTEMIVYSFTLLPPEKKKLNKDIVVDFCPINQSFEKQISDSSSANNRGYAEALRRWRSAFSGDIGLYSYYRKYAWRSAPNVFPHYIQKDMQWYASLPLQGISTYAEPGDWCTYELNHYMLALVSWDPQVNIDEACTEFFKYRYGNSWKQARNAYATLEAIAPVYGSIPFTSLKPADSIKQAIDRVETDLVTVDEIANKETDITTRNNFLRLALMLRYLHKDLHIQWMRASDAERTEIENEIRSLVNFLAANIDKGVFILTGRNDFARFTKKYGLTNQSLLD
jgi:hypothetical protein